MRVATANFVADFDGVSFFSQISKEREKERKEREGVVQQADIGTTYTGTGHTHTHLHTHRGFAVQCLRGARAALNGNFPFFGHVADAARPIAPSLSLHPTLPPCLSPLFPLSLLCAFFYVYLCPVAVCCA